MQSVECLKAETLSAVKTIAHGFFMRIGGVSKGAYASLNGKRGGGDELACVRENRRRACATLGVGASGERFAACTQVHAAKALIVESDWNFACEPEADALVTRLRGVTLGIMTADCAPVLFADEVAGVIGAAHAGWRGALGGVLEATVEAMEALGASRRGIRAAVGPCLWQKSYEVGEAFPLPFIEKDPDAARFFGPSNRVGHSLFDLPGYVLARLEALGLFGLTPSCADTFSDAERFFSYRRQTLGFDDNAGRQIAAITLREEPKP